MADEAAPQDVVVSTPAETFPVHPESVEPEIKEPILMNGGEVTNSRDVKEVAIEPVAPASPVPASMIAPAIPFFHIYLIY
jgi:hypothetical protein